MSQGGAVGALAAQRRPASAFLVLLSAPGVDGRAALRAQLEATLRLSGIAGSMAEQYRALFDQFTGIVLDRAAGRDAQRQRMLTFLAGPGRALIPPYAFIPRETEPLADMLLGDWYFSNVSFDPAQTYAGLAVPVLAIGGALDPVAPPAIHLPAIEALLGSGPHDRRIVTLPRGNHLLQSATTGLPTEYRTIDHAISPEALDTITTWLSGQVARRR